VEAMAILLESPTRILDEVSNEISRGIRRPDRRECGGRGHHAYRCPRCGTLEHTDSVIAGTCPLCPGLVALVTV